jgi:hypothetical protein
VDGWVLPEASTRPRGTTPYKERALQVCCSALLILVSYPARSAEVQALFMTDSSKLVSVFTEESRDTGSI